MHAYLISGRSQESLEFAVSEYLRTWNVSRFDTIMIEKEEEKKEISIQQIREMKRQLNLTPTQSPFIVAVIRHADLLTTPAQNALLKILEEPPAKAIIILTTTMPDALLETIQSRCQKVMAKNQQHTTNDMTLESVMELCSLSVSELFRQIDIHAQSGLDALLYVDRALDTIHHAIITGKTSIYSRHQCASLAKKLLITRSQLSLNVNPKLALDSAFL